MANSIITAFPVLKGITGMGYVSYYCIDFLHYVQLTVHCVLILLFSLLCYTILN